MHRHQRLFHFFLLILAGVLVAGTGLVARQQLAGWTHRQVRDRCVGEIQSLPERQAAALVLRLDLPDADQVAVLVPLLADPRPGVADAAARALAGQVESWRHLPRAEASPCVAALAHELAVHADSLPTQQRRVAHDLAARLVVWPLDPNDPGSMQSLADCELVLRLPLLQEAEPRIATTLPRLAPHVAQVLPADPLPPQLPQGLPANEPAAEPVVPRVYGSVEPERLPDASQERPVEPKRFLAPKAAKIEG
ncbi:MAG: hypothetical protein WD872_02395 [Pirellulaceae bacterium]